MGELEQPQSGVSRRTVTKAMAWAVAVIAVASSVPAFASSQGVLNFTGGGCKLPGNSQSGYKGNAFRLSATNTTANPITVTITSVTLAGSSLGSATVINLSTCSLLGNPFVIPANTTLANLALVTTDAGNSQNGVLSVTFTVSGVSGSQNATVTVPDVPPLQGASCTAFSQAEANCINSLI